MQLTFIGSSMTKRNKSCESEVMLTMQRKELLKKSAIRYAEYYGMLFTYPVAGAPDMVIALFVGMVLFVVNEADRVKNQVIMQMVFIDVSCQNKLILAA